MATLILRGGGDLASGVALRCKRAGLHPIITEIAQPMAVRRSVAFAEAMYTGKVQVEEVIGRKAENLSEIEAILQAGEIPVINDPGCDLRHLLPPVVLVDGRMTKQAPDLGREAAALVIGLGPGFRAGKNCHAVIETNRGHFLGRVLWQGLAESDTGVPEGVSSHEAERVLRAPTDGILEGLVEIGSIVEQGQAIAKVEEEVIRAPFRGLVRGLIHPGYAVHKGMKVGDLDPRCNPLQAQFVSEKSLAIGGGVLEAILSRPEIRRLLWD